MANDPKRRYNLVPRFSSSDIITWLAIASIQAPAIAVSRFKTEHGAGIMLGISLGYIVRGLIENICPYEGD